MNTDKIYAEQLANEYAPKNTSKVMALKKLDAKAKRPTAIFGYTFGILCTLLLGIGMCLCMQQIGPGGVTFFMIGIVCGLLGILGVIVNIPICRYLLKKGRKKYAFEIVELAKSISETSNG